MTVFVREEEYWEVRNGIKDSYNPICLCYDEETADRLCAWEIELSGESHYVQHLVRRFGPDGSVRTEEI